MRVQGGGGPGAPRGAAPQQFGGVMGAIAQAWRHACAQTPPHPGVNGFELRGWRVAALRAARSPRATRAGGGRRRPEHALPPAAAQAQAPAVAAACQLVPPRRKPTRHCSQPCGSAGTGWQRRPSTSPATSAAAARRQRSRRCWVARCATTSPSWRVSGGGPQGHRLSGACAPQAARRVRACLLTHRTCAPPPHRPTRPGQPGIPDRVHRGCAAPGSPAVGRRRLMVPRQRHHGRHPRGGHGHMRGAWQRAPPPTQRAPLRVQCERAGRLYAGVHATSVRCAPGAGASPHADSAGDCVCRGRGARPPRRRGACRVPHLFRGQQ